MTRLELLALMAAIVHSGGDASRDVERADAILRAAEHRYPVDRPEEAVTPVTQCLAMSSGGWSCSLPEGHKGDFHAAYEDHAMDGELLEKWPVEAVLAKGAAV